MGKVRPRCQVRAGTVLRVGAAFCWDYDVLPDTLGMKRWITKRGYGYGYGLYRCCTVAHRRSGIGAATDANPWESGWAMIPFLLIILGN